MLHGLEHHRLDWPRNEEHVKLPIFSGGTFNRYVPLTTERLRNQTVSVPFNIVPDSL